MHTHKYRYPQRYAQVSQVHTHRYTGTQRYTQVHTGARKYTHTGAQVPAACDAHLHLSLTQGPWFKSSHLWISAQVTLFLECWSQVALPRGQHRGPPSSWGSHVGIPHPGLPPLCSLPLSPSGQRPSLAASSLVGGPVGCAVGPREDWGPPPTQ